MESVDTIAIDEPTLTRLLAQLASWRIDPHLAPERVDGPMLGQWRVRHLDLFADDFVAMAELGMVHVQFWHPATGTSVVTPSRATHRRCEVRLPGGARLAAPCLCGIEQELARRFALEMPPRVELNAAWRRLAMLPAQLAGAAVEALAHA